MKLLFTTRYGSHLYGTNTPASDVDLKHVFLPDLDDLLMCREVSNIVKKTNNLENTKNTSADVDETFVPFQKFAIDFVNGQTYALELAFAIDKDHARQVIFDQKFLDFVKELRTKFLTSNIKSMMEYVVNQATLYSYKGERFNLVNEVNAILNSVDKDLRISEIEHLFNDVLTKYPKYFVKENYLINETQYKPCFKLLEKTIPFTDHVSHSKTVVEALIKRYGSRVKDASTDNVDWKATMHALRIVDEGLELLLNKTITLPVSKDRADFLLSVKRGEKDLEEVSKEIVEKLEKLKEIEKQVDLPTNDQQFREEFEKWMLVWVRKFYNLNH